MSLKIHENAVDDLLNLVRDGKPIPQQLLTAASVENQALCEIAEIVDQRAMAWLCKTFNSGWHKNCAIPKDLERTIDRLTNVQNELAAVRGGK